MSEPQVLYEAKLAKTGVLAIWGAIMLILLFSGFGWLVFFATGSREISFPIGCMVFGGIFILVSGMWKMFSLHRNPGVYRISIDNHGLYVHSDAPTLAPSFSVIAPDIVRLIHTTIIDKGGEADTENHEYHVETKTGERYRIETLLLIKPKQPAMELFEKIVDRFRWVEIMEEVKEAA